MCVVYVNELFFKKITILIVLNRVPNLFYIKSAFMYKDPKWIPLDT